MHGNVVEISTADLATIASGYDPTKHEAPHVIGHPATNAPAYGWVRGLRVDGDVLIADTDQFDSAFADCVNASRWKKRSASFLRPDAPDNPTPGQYYLNHVGWLGGMTPAVKGLRDVQLAAADQLVEFATDRRWAFRDVGDMFRRLRDFFIERDGTEVADQVLPNWQINALLEAAQPDAETFSSIPGLAFAAAAVQEPPMSDPNKTVDLAAQQRDLDQRAQSLVEREQAIADREIKARRDDAVAFASQLASKEVGKLLPAEVPAVVELLLILPEDKTLSFAAADGSATTAKPADAFRQFLTNLGQRIDYREKSQREDMRASNTTSFAAPAGVLVDQVGLELHAKAITYQQQHEGVSYLDAVRAVGG